MINNKVINYYRSQLMSRDSLLDLEKNVDRCIERLTEPASQSTVEQQLPAFCYTARTLGEYITKEPNHMKAKYYYELFEGQFNRYIIKILGNSDYQAKFQKPNKQQIIKEITEMLEKHRHLKTQSTETKSLVDLIKKRQDELFFNDQLKKIRKFYEDHNIDQTCIAIQALKQKIKGSQYMKQLFSKQLQGQFREYEQEYKKMLQRYYAFEETDGWISDKDQQNFKMQYKVYEQERTISMRVSAEIEVEMLPFMAIACEIDLQKHYMSFVQTSEQRRSSTIKSPRNLKIGYSLTSVPLLADRQCYFYAIGYDRIKTTGSIFIYTESFEDNYEFQKKFQYYIQNSSDKVFLKVHYFCLEYKPITKKRAQIRFASKADFKLSFLPIYILLVSARVFSSNYFNSIIDRSKKFKGSIWEEKVKKNPQMYNFFQEKIDEYFGNV